MTEDKFPEVTVGVDGKGKVNAVYVNGIELPATAFTLEASVGSLDTVTVSFHSRFMGLKDK